MDRIYNVVKHNGEQILICGQLWKCVGTVRSAKQEEVVSEYIVLAAENTPHHPGDGAANIH